MERHSQEKATVGEGGGIEANAKPGEYPVGPWTEKGLAGDRGHFREVEGAVETGRVIW